HLTVATLAAWASMRDLYCLARETVNRQTGRCRGESGVHVVPALGHLAEDREGDRAYNADGSERNPDVLRVIGVPKQLCRPDGVQPRDFLELDHGFRALHAHELLQRRDTAVPWL